MKTKIRIFAPLVSRRRGKRQTPPAFYGATASWGYTPEMVREFVWHLVERGLWPRGYWYHGVCEMRLVFPIKPEVYEDA